MLAKYINPFSKTNYGCWSFSFYFFYFWAIIARHLQNVARLFSCSDPVVTDKQTNYYNPPPTLGLILKTINCVLYEFVKLHTGN